MTGNRERKNAQGIPLRAVASLLAGIAALAFFKFVDGTAVGVAMGASVFVGGLVSVAGDLWRSRSGDGPKHPWQLGH